MKADGFRKKSICCVALQLRRCSVRVSTLHSSVFARLASGAFYEAIVLFIFYDFIISYPNSFGGSSSSRGPSYVSPLRQILFDRYESNYVMINSPSTTSLFRPAYDSLPAVR